jgi:tetratricopeptide (TPR) repeat protein
MRPWRTFGAVILAIPLWCAVAGAQAQGATVGKALDLEGAGRLREAVAVWRQAIAEGAVAAGILGLERAFTQLGQEDSVLTALDTLVARSPADRTLRSVQLRVLSSLGREREARAAFDEWTTLVPKDPAPYREFAGQLLSDGRAALADTVLQRATAALGSTRELVIEVAQLRAALGLWPAAAVAWREALAATAYLEQAAVFSLAPAPRPQRDTVRALLASPPASAGARRTLGFLELQWGAPRNGWQAIASLTPADSAYDTWSDFALEAERQGAWIPARDALAAMYRARPAVAAVALRAATAALNGGDPASALALASSARARLDPSTWPAQGLALQVRALAQLGRAADAEALLGRDGGGLDERTRRGFAIQIAWGWIRAGQVDRARAMLAGAAGDEEEEVVSWMALFDGDLAKARKGLRRPSDATADVVTAMSLLGRTRADSAPEVGRAYLALARLDSAQAAQRFERAAESLSDAAPLLLALAARIHSARRQDGAAIVLWQRIVGQYASAPEAAEADLEWARTLRRKGDASGAQERLEHLILSYPQSALVPQARRELEAVRTGASDA